MPVRAIPLASWPEGLNRITCSSTVGGSQSVSAPARKVIQGSQPVSNSPVLTRTRGGFICVSAMVPKRMRFSIMRARAGRLFMALMVAP